MKLPTFKTRQGELGVDSARAQKRAIAAGKVSFCGLTHGHYPGKLLPAAVLPGLSSVGVLDAKGEQDWGVEPHRNEGIEIVFLETGRMVYGVDEHFHDLKAGQMILTQPWQLHRLGAPCLGPGRLHWVLIDVGIRRPHQAWKWPSWIMLSSKEKRELASLLRSVTRPVWAATPALRRKFQDVAACLAAFEVRQGTRLTLLLNGILLHVLEALREQCRGESHGRAGGHRVVELFLKDLHDSRERCAEEWTLESMASHCRMGTTLFSRCSHDLVNVSPWEYLIRCRLGHALELLQRKPGLKVTDIAFECGFTSSQYFATRFRRHFNASPREYQADGSWG